MGFMKMYEQNKQRAVTTGNIGQQHSKYSCICRDSFKYNASLNIHLQTVLLTNKQNKKKKEQKKEKEQGKRSFLCLLKSQVHRKES